MDFIQHLITYYKGERFEAVLLTLFGLLMMGVAVAMWQHIDRNVMVKGLLYPIAFLALFTFCAGSFGVYNNNQRIAELPMQYTMNATEVIKKEVNRFEGASGVNTWWMPLKILWTALVLCGIIVSFATKNDFINGLSIGLILIGAMGFVVDGFAHQRAKIYSNCLLEQ